MREPLTREERLIKLAALKVKAKKESQNFARDGLIPRLVVHPVLLSGVSTVATDALGEEYVSLVKVLKQFSIQGSQAIELWNLNALNSSQDTNTESHYEKELR